MKNKIRERGSYIYFYTGSLNIWATSSLSEQPESDHVLYQDFWIP